MNEPDVPDFAIGRITSDMEIGARIFMQIRDLNVDVLIPEQGKRDAYHKTLIDVMRKPESVKYHCENLARIVETEITSRQVQSTETKTITFDKTTGVEKEFEAFLMQGKATLDVLVKTFKPLFGISLHSYGEGGIKVVGALRRNLAKDALERADIVIQLIEHAEPWARQWFGTSRDTITHYRALETTGFIVLPGEGAEIQHIPPRHESGMPFHEGAQALYQNLLHFCEDFLVFSLRVILPPMFEIGMIPEEKRDPNYPRAYGLFLCEPRHE
jgi:hypothetical protein